MIQLTDHSPAGAGQATLDSADSTAGKAAQFFRLLGDDTRLQIIRCLIEHRELHVAALCKLLGRTQPLVSHHLAVLRLSRLVAVDRRGKQNFYRIASARLGRLLRVAERAADACH